MALVEMLRSLDPFTTYINPEAKIRNDAAVQGNFSGVGIRIRKDAATDMLRVVTPIKGGPAYKAGLRQATLSPRSPATWTATASPCRKRRKPHQGPDGDDAVKKLLGQEGTKVKLTVRREGTDKPLEFEITRGRVELRRCFGVKRKSNDDWNFMLDDEKKIGYVRLSQFAGNTYRDLQPRWRT